MDAFLSYLGTPHTQHSQLTVFSASQSTEGLTWDKLPSHVIWSIFSRLADYRTSVAFRKACRSFRDLTYLPYIAEVNASWCDHQNGSVLLQQTFQEQRNMRYVRIVPMCLSVSGLICGLGTIGIALYSHHLQAIGIVSSVAFTSMSNGCRKLEDAAEEVNEEPIHYQDKEYLRAWFEWYRNPFGTLQEARELLAQRAELDSSFLVHLADYGIILRQHLPFLRDALAVGPFADDLEERWVTLKF